MEDITVPVVNDIATFSNIDVYEGTYVTVNLVTIPMIQIKDLS